MLKSGYILWFIIKRQQKISFNTFGDVCQSGARTDNWQVVISQTVGTIPSCHFCSCSIPFFLNAINGEKIFYDRPVEWVVVLLLLFFLFTFTML